MKGFKRKQHKPVKKGQSNHNSVVGTVKKDSHLPIKPFVILGIVVVLIISIWLVVDFIQDQRNQKKTSQACSTAVITSQTAVDLANSSAAVLKPTVDKIVKTNGYNKDPSCLYVLTKYYIGTGDPVKGRVSYDQLTKLYTSNDVYDSKIKNSVGSPEQFKPILEMLEQQQKDINQTSKVFKP